MSAQYTRADVFTFCAINKRASEGAREQEKEKEPVAQRQEMVSDTLVMLKYFIMVALM